MTQKWLVPKSVHYKEIPL